VADTPANAARMIGVTPNNGRQILATIRKKLRAA